MKLIDALRYVCQHIAPIGDHRKFSLRLVNGRWCIGCRTESTLISVSNQCSYFKETIDDLPCTIGLISLDVLATTLSHYSYRDCTVEVVESKGVRQLLLTGNDCEATIGIQSEGLMESVGFELPPFQDAVVPICSFVETGDAYDLLSYWIGAQDSERVCFYSKGNKLYAKIGVPFNFNKFLLGEADAAIHEETSWFSAKSIKQVLKIAAGQKIEWQLWKNEKHYRYGVCNAIGLSGTLQSDKAVIQYFIAAYQ